MKYPPAWRELYESVNCRTTSHLSMKRIEEIVDPEVIERAAAVETFALWCR